MEFSGELEDDKLDDVEPGEVGALKQRLKATFDGDDAGETSLVVDIIGYDPGTSTLFFLRGPVDRNFWPRIRSQRRSCSFFSPRREGRGLRKLFLASTARRTNNIKFSATNTLPTAVLFVFLAAWARKRFLNLCSCPHGKKNEQNRR
jgi:hypothetical protein